MSPKSEKLQTRIQEIQKFISTKLERNENFQAIFQKVEKIAACLAAEKLTVRIVSSNLISAQALQTFLNTSELLLKFYQFEVNLLPHQVEKTDRGGSATLLLQADSNQQECYKLPSNREVFIGRNPDADIFFNPEQYKKVSWNHAKVQPYKALKWELCDLNSSNGTYVNARRLQGCQSLQTGDRITLASPSASQACPELIFEVQLSTSAYEEQNLYKELVDCDVLCLVTDANKMLSSNEQSLVTRASEAQIAMRVLVADIPKATSFNLVENEIYLQSLAINSSFEIVALPLYLCCLNSQEINVETISQKELEKFCKSLELLVKRKPEDILAQRLAVQVLEQLAFIERVFDTEVEAITQEIKQQEEKLQQLAKDDLKEQTKKALKKANDDKDKYFKQVKIEINQSKAALLDPFSKKSIANKIQEHIDKLRPVVVNRGGFKYVQLQSDSTATTGNVNADMIQFCSFELDKWANKEWEQICIFYAEGGLNRLAQNIYATLNFIPTLKLDKSLFNSNQRLDLQRSLMNSFMEVPCESRYQEVAPITYVLKQVRANMMQFTFIIGFGAMFLGLNVGGGGKQMISNFTQPLRSNPFLFGTVLFILICVITYTYRKDNSLKLEEIGEKLKKELSNHYQSLAKNLTEKIVQDFSTTLETEERCIKEALEIVNERFTSHIIDVEKSQLLLKNSIEQQKLQQKNLEKEKVEFQKLKRL